MRLRLLIVACTLAATSCAADDPLDAFPDVRKDPVVAVVNETEALDVDLNALEEAATDEPVAPEEIASESAEIEIPDGALDFTEMAAVALDIQDNAFTQRVVVVSAGTEVTWTNQGRNEHNVRPAIEGAFEPISTADLAEKGQSASIVFNAAGDFPYFCSLHGTARNGQTGRIIVVP